MKIKWGGLMRVLSLFDGMSCAMLALQDAGVNVSRYVAYEIDKYAVQTSSHNFPMIEHKGDVFEADFTEFEGFDFLLGGSPCTYWSVAQKVNRETEASGMGWELFSQYVRALKEAKPKYFIYENNKSMSKAIRESISSTFGFEPICINSALVSAQNRQRLYWCGIRQADGTYKKADIPQPEDRGILLKDVLESATERIPAYGNKDKGRPINALYPNNCGGFERRKFSDNPNKQQVDMIAEPVCVAERGRYNADGVVEQHFEAREDGKTNVLTTVQKDNNVAERVGTFPNEAKNQQKHDSQQYRIYGVNAKSVTLCGGGGNGIYAAENQAKRIGGLYGQVTRWGIYDTDGKTPTLTASMGMGGGHVPMVSKETEETNITDKNPTDKKQVYEVKDGQITIKGKQYPIKLVDGYYIIRKLTVRECMRLQTVPEWYEFPVSNAQAYKMLGNGWTVQVISHLIKHTLTGAVEDSVEQCSLL